MACRRSGVRFPARPRFSTGKPFARRAFLFGVISRKNQVPRAQVFLGRNPVETQLKDLEEISEARTIMHKSGTIQMLTMRRCIAAVTVSALLLGGRHRALAQSYMKVPPVKMNLSGVNAAAGRAC